MVSTLWNFVKPFVALTYVYLIYNSPHDNVFELQIVDTLILSKDIKISCINEFWVYVRTVLIWILFL